MTKNTEHDSLVGIESVIERLDAAEAILDDVVRRLNKLAAQTPVSSACANASKSNASHSVPAQSKAHGTAPQRLNAQGIDQ